jgi:FKBP-type peptidyl-prolyl cis-trans isomerase
MASLGALSVVALASCSLAGDTKLPELLDPSTQTYAAVTGVNIATMTRVNTTVYQQDVVVGTGRVIAAGDSLRVYYVGRLSSGFRFDSLGRPADPAKVVLDSTLIRGWVSGIPGMKTGGIRRLAIGPGSGYGYNTVRDAQGGTLIPSNSVIAFDVEVVASVPKP